MDTLILFLILNFSWMIINGYMFREDCRDRLSEKKCKFLQDHHACYTHPHRMHNFCPKTCGTCGKDDDPCGAYQCPHNKKCVLDENMQPYCKCHIRHCRKAKETGPICTRSGRTFRNLCVLLREECKTNQIFIVDKYEECKKPYTCGDAARESSHGLCESWKDHGFCDSAPEIMQMYCAKTCDLCKEPVAFAPPLCASSRYGCCWNDLEKSATGPNMRGCRRCKDLDLCSSFVGECGKDRNHHFMKKHCPFTCRYCDGTNATKKKFVNS